MERLTEHHYNKTVGAYMVCSGACIDDDFDCNDCKKLAEIVDRLAAYEDTGLEPEEIDALQKREQGLAEMLVNVSCGCAVTYERLQELAQAEKDGRLVVLPCKLRDILWTYRQEPSPQLYSFRVTAVSTLNGKTVLNTDVFQVISASDVGKTVFLTRAEAEAALERRKEEK